MSHLLVAENVTKKFGTHTALSNVSLEIPENCIYGLLGPNGAGKTTLIRIINQITHPDSGHVYFDGRPLAPEHIATIGYLPEERGLYKSMKVGEQALYLAQLKGLSKAEARKRLNYWFERLGIEGWWNKKVQELSKGMAQKIQFIVTVMHQPKLLIFDEPFSGFDPINAGKIKDEIINLKEQGTTIIFSTHRMESVEELCEYIALLDRAEKILDGKLSEIKKVYKNNIFSVGIQIKEDSEKVLKSLGSYEILDDAFDSGENQLNFTVKLRSNNTSDFLGMLSKKGIINNFEENIPSANDIFIRTVNHRNGHG